MCGNDKNSSICETSQDPQASHMVDVSMKQLDQKSAPDQTFTIDKTDSNIESCQISSNKTDVSDSPCPSSHQYAQELDPRSPSDAITRTPICISKPKSLEEIMKDPRSPTVGIDRTPINLSHVENSRSASDECYLANAYKAEGTVIECYCYFKLLLEVGKQYNAWLWNRIYSNCPCFVLEVQFFTLLSLFNFTYLTESTP